MLLCACAQVKLGAPLQTLPNDTYTLIARSTGVVSQTDFVAVRNATRALTVSC